MTLYKSLRAGLLASFFGQRLKGGHFAHCSHSPIFLAAAEVSQGSDLLIINAFIDSLENQGVLAVQ